MKKINFQQDVLPHLVAVIIFLAVVVIFYRPVFFEGKALSQHDILMAKGPSKALEDFREESGREGLWASNIFSGMPAYLVGVNWSGDLFRYVYHLSYLDLPSPARLSFPAMLSFYILLIAFGVRPYFAIAGSIAYALSSFNIISIIAGHNLKVLAVAYAPLVIAGVHLVFSRKRIAGLILTIIGLYLQIRVNHLQITYYLILILVFYGIFQLYNAYKTKTLPYFFQSVGILMIPLVLAVGLNLGKLWSVYSYSKYSIRGPSELTAKGQDAEGGLSRDYAFNYSNGIFEPLTLMIPNIMGGPSIQELDRSSNTGEALRRNNVPGNQAADFLKNSRTYWGKQPFTGGPFYAGATIIFLFILGILFTKGPVKYWLITITIVSIVLSWGKNFSSFNYFLFDFLPGYNKFRSVTFIITIALISIPLLGFIGLNKLIDEPEQSINLKKLFTALAIAGGFCILVLLMSGFFSYHSPVDEQLPNWLAEALVKDRKGLLLSDTFRSMVLILLLGASLYFYLKKKINVTVLASIFVLLITFDLWNVSRRYLDIDDFERNPVKNYFSPNEANAEILKDDGDYRVLNFRDAFNDGRTSYFHQSIGGYHGAKLLRYQNLIEKPLSNDIQNTIAKIQDNSMDFEESHVLNMLNTKYFLAGTSRNTVIKNIYSNGSAWLVKTVNHVNSPDEEYKLVAEINTKTDAVVDVSKFKVSAEDFDASGQIKLISKSPDRLKYECINDSKSFAVFSEIFYPDGWKATINGSETDIIRVNYVLRGLEIPSGNNEIEFVYHPSEYYTGNPIMKWFSIGTYLLVLGLIITGFTRKKGQTKE
jgi:hypothetical protein